MWHNFTGADVPLLEAVSASGITVYLWSFALSHAEFEISTLNFPHPFLPKKGSGLRSFHAWDVWVDAKFKVAAHKVSELRASLKALLKSPPVHWQVSDDVYPEEIKVARDRDVQLGLIEVPPHTHDIVAFVRERERLKIADVLASVTGRSLTAMSPDKDVFYHASDRNHKVGKVIEPYYRGFESSWNNVMERMFEQRRKVVGAKVPRLKVAYAFDNPDAAVRYSFCRGRRVYRVVPTGPIERRDMHCLDAIGEYVQPLNLTSSSFQVEWDAVVAGTFFDTTVRSPAMKRRYEVFVATIEIMDAYWRGEPCPRYIPNSRIAQYGPAWEVVCAQGFKVIGVEDRVAERLVRDYVRILVEWEAI